MSEIKRGVVKWYNEGKSFGFITAEDGDDIFVHRSGISDASAGLQPEQEVMFDLMQGDKGQYAINVKPFSKI